MDVTVAIGQVWADADPRSAGRRIEITEIGDSWAKGRILATERNVSDAMVGRTTRKISLKRFRAHHRGYRLVSSPDTAGQPTS